MSNSSSKGSKASQQGGNLNNKFQVIFPGVSQKVSTSVTHAESSAVGVDCTVVRLYCDQDVYIDIAASPVATASKMFLPANTVEYFGCAGGDKISALRASADGTLYMTEGAV